jgi:hypothetical protein
MAGTEIDVGFLSRLQEDRFSAFIERAGIANLHRGEEVRSGEVMPLLSGVDEVQPVGQAAAKPELVRDDLILDHHRRPRPRCHGVQRQRPQSQ